jgi:hypothetical protein
MPRRATDAGECRRVRAVVEGMASDMHLGRVGASVVIYVKQRVGLPPEVYCVLYDLSIHMHINDGV